MPQYHPLKANDFSVLVSILYIQLKIGRKEGWKTTKETA
jgi:hypothetical protein